ncbi:MAG TPA: hypothetical protein VNY06_05675 [Methylocella sp.]|jgi:hypothetical protein|nr:hypothetical protein [Methylocella sp.]
MSDNEPHGDFTVITEPTRNDHTQTLIETLKRASGARYSAIATVHKECVIALSRLYVPHISPSPSPDQFRDMADFLVHWARVADRVLKIVGDEARANTTENINLGYFQGQFQATVEGYSSFELERCAANVEAEWEEFGGYDPDYQYEDRRAAE